MAGGVHAQQSSYVVTSITLLVVVQGQQWEGSLNISVPSFIAYIFIILVSQ